MVQSKHELNKLPWVLGCEVLRNAYSWYPGEGFQYLLSFIACRILKSGHPLRLSLPVLKMHGHPRHCSMTAFHLGSFPALCHTRRRCQLLHSILRSPLHWAGTVTQAGPTLVWQNSLGGKQSSHLLYRKSQAAEWSQVQTSRVKCQSPYDILCISRDEHIFLSASKWHPRINMVLHFAFSFN